MYQKCLEVVPDTNQGYLRMKKSKRMIGLVAVIGILIVTAFGVNAFSETTEVSSVTFTKTKNKCTKCSCSGYHGYKHQNGTYEGNCSNTDQYGHKCGHGPEKHGLKKW